MIRSWWNRLCGLQAAADASDDLFISSDENIDILASAGDNQGDGPPKFRMLVYSGGKMRPSGFFRDVVLDLSGLKIAKGKRPVFLGHDQRRIIGHTHSITVDGAIRAEGVISGTGSDAEEVIATSRNGFPWRASIGASIDSDLEVISETETVTVNGRKFKGPLFIVRASTLKEVSFVALPGDERTSARISAQHGSEDKNMTFEQWLTARGFKLAELSEAQQTSLRAMFDAEMKAANDPEDDSARGTSVNAAADAAGHDGGSSDQTSAADVTANADADSIADYRRQMAAETARISRIGEICAQYDNPTLQVQGRTETIESMAISEGWDETRTELEALRESRPQAPTAHSNGADRDSALSAVQGALLLRAGVALDHPSFITAAGHAMRIPSFLRAAVNDDRRQRLMEQSHRYSDTSLVDICAAALRFEGQTVPSNRHDLITAAMSTSSLTNIFTTNINAVVLATYTEIGDTTRGWTRETDVSDFKVNERARLTKGPNLEKLPRGKSAEHASRSDTAENYRIHRFAKQFTVDEQDIIDDRFNALSDVPREMGLAAARVRPDLVYAVLFANAVLSDSIALFHASHGNLATAAALADATLRAGLTAISTQSENGVNLNLAATHLLVPQTQRFAARQLVRSAEVRNPAATGDIGTRNPLQDEQLQIVSDSRLDNGVTDPDSGTTYAGATGDWYLADSRGHTIEVGFLRGTGRAPRITSWRKNGEDGQYLIGWSVKIDIGAKALDYRPFYKGAA